MALGLILIFEFMYIDIDVRKLTCVRKIENKTLNISTRRETRTEKNSTKVYLPGLAVFVRPMRHDSRDLSNF